MIQRKQTLFLLQVLFLHVALLFISCQNVITASHKIAVNMLPLQSAEVSSRYYHYIAIAVNLIGLVMTIATIFLYRKRELQVKMCMALMSLWTKLTVLITFFTLVVQNDKVVSVQKNYFNLVIGLFAIGAAFMALRFIKKDIALIKSADRLR
jgi:hypothetical protein